MYLVATLAVCVIMVWTSFCLVLVVLTNSLFAKDTVKLDTKRDYWPFGATGRKRGEAIYSSPPELSGPQDIL